MKRLIPFVCTAAALFSFLTMQASAATVEDVYSAMRDVGCTDGMIEATRVKYERSDHDENGMELGGEYHTFDEWATRIRQNGLNYVLALIAGTFNVTPEDLIAVFNLPEQTEPPVTGTTAENGEPAVTTVTTVFEPSVTTNKPFSQMTLDEMRAYTDSLPYDERVAFLASLTPEQRRSILRQLAPEQKADVAAGLAELGGQMGLNVSVDKADEDGIRLSVRDADGRLIESSGLGLTVDPTGWDTTWPVCSAGGMILTAAAGIYMIARKQKNKEEHHG